MDSITKEELLKISPEDIDLRLSSYILGPVDNPTNLSTVDLLKQVLTLSKLNNVEDTTLTPLLTYSTVAEQVMTSIPSLAELSEEGDGFFQLPDLPLPVTGFATHSEVSEVRSEISVPPSIFDHFKEVSEILKSMLSDVIDFLSLGYLELPNVANDVDIDYEVSLKIPMEVNDTYFSKLSQFLPGFSIDQIIEILNQLKENKCSLLGIYNKQEALELYKKCKTFHIDLIIIPKFIIPILDNIAHIIKYLFECIETNSELALGFTFSEDLFKKFIRSVNYYPTFMCNWLIKYVSHFVPNYISILMDFIRQDDFIEYYKNNNILHSIYCVLFSNAECLDQIFADNMIYTFLLDKIYNLLLNQDYRTKESLYDWSIISLSCDNLIYYILLLSDNKPSGVKFHTMAILKTIFAKLLDFDKLVIKPFQSYSRRLDIEYDVIKRITDIMGKFASQFALKTETYYSNQNLLQFIEYYEEYIKLITEYIHNEEVTLYPFSIMRTFMTVVLYQNFIYHKLPADTLFNRDNCDEYLLIYMNPIIKYCNENNLLLFETVYNPYINSLNYKTDILMLQLLCNFYSPHIYLKNIYSNLNIEESTLLDYNINNLLKRLKILITLFTVPLKEYNEEEIIENDIGNYLLVHKQMLHEKLDEDSLNDFFYRYILSHYYTLHSTSNYETITRIYDRIKGENSLIKYYNPFNSDIPFSQHESMLLLYNYYPVFQHNDNENNENIVVEFQMLSHVVELPLCYDIVLYLFASYYDNENNYLIYILLKMLNILLFNPFIYTDFLAQCMIGINNNPSIYEYLSITMNNNPFLSECIKELQQKLIEEYTNLRHHNNEDYKDLIITKKDLSSTCKSCNALTVERYCDKCKCCYCIKCSDRIHNQIENFSHFPRPLCYCGKCNSEGKMTLAELLCIDCEIFYCKSCSEIVHTSLDSRDHRFNCLYTITSKTYRMKGNSKSEFNPTSNEKLLLSNYTPFHMVILTYYHSTILGKLFNIRFKANDKKEYTLYVISSNNPLFASYYYIQSSLPYQTHIIRYYTHFESPIASQFESWYPINNEDTYHFLIFDFIPMTLNQYIQIHNPLTRKEIITILSQVSKAVMFLFNRHVIYRNLSFDTIILDDGVWKISDLCYSIITNDKYEFKEKYVQGIMYTLPPEILLNDDDKYEEVTNNYTLTPPFSLGIICYQLMFGCLPYPNYPLKLEIREQTPESEDMKELYEVVCKMINAEPENRMTFNDFFLYINSEFDKIQ